MCNDDNDVSRYIRRLYRTNPLREPILKEIIKEMRLPSGSHGLDVGCGIGLNTLLLADAVGPGGHVTGIDIEKELLAMAKSKVKKSGLEGRVAFEQGDASKLCYGENKFDWLCSIDFAGCVILDPVLLLKEFARVVKPGGIIYIIIWSSQKLLPGYPKLEALLNSTASGIAPFEASMTPDMHFMNALGWFKKAGLTNPAARTYAADIQSPLSSEIREAMTELLKMRWGENGEEVAPEVWAEYRRLCSNDSPDFILGLPDYYAFFTYSVFYSIVN